MDIYPPQLDSLGLEAAVRDLLDGLGADGLTTRLEVEHDLPALSDDVRRLLYRGTQEGLRNVRKHATPTRVDVRVTREAGAFILEVTNDGLAAVAGSTGMGLRLAALQAVQAGGFVEFGERELGLWRVRLVVPLDEPG